MLQLRRESLYKKLAVLCLVYTEQIQTRLAEQVNMTLPSAHQILLSDMMLDDFGNNALYKLGANWSELKKFQIPASDDTFSMVFAALPKTIVSVLGVQLLQAFGPVQNNLDNEKTSLPNNCVIYTTLGEVALE